MKFYFSGVSGTSEYRMLDEAKVRHVLVDQFDLPNVPRGREGVALDSGAYRAGKKNLRLNVDDYIRVIRDSGPFDFIVSLDVIGDPASSRDNWEAMKRAGVRALPVWQWGAAPEDELKAYLDEAQVVGIGGLATSMRNKDARMLDELTAICESFPDRLHIFGMNWLRAIELLKDKVYSADSSKWLDGARYSHVIFTNTRTGHLSQAPAKALNLTLDRSERCILSARNLEEYISRTPAQEKAA
jgi:hypothetical protein